MSRLRSIASILVLIGFSACNGLVKTGGVNLVPTWTSLQDLSSTPTISNFESGSTTSTPFAPVNNPTQPFPLITTMPPVLEPGEGRPSYEIHAILDYSGHTLAVDEEIHFQNQTGEILFSLDLAVEPNLWKGCFLLETLLINGHEILDAEASSNKLVIPLPIPILPGEIIDVYLDYSLRLPTADSHHLFGYNGRQVNLVNWYPTLPPYANGWVIHPPSAVGETQVYEDARFDVTIALAETTKPITFAASATGKIDLDQMVYHMDHARTFAISASEYFQSISREINGVEIISYYFKGDESEAQIVLDETTKAVATFSDIFSPFPYQSLSIVESPYYDGMEYDGLFFLSQDFYSPAHGGVINNLVDIAVHETAHQWWFGSVGNDQALEPWLDEALATYSEKLFYLANYSQVSEWRYFRITSFYPTGWVDNTVYQARDQRSYANAVYLRGALFLEEVSDAMGEPDFSEFIRAYATEMSGKIAIGEDFFRILKQHARLDLSKMISSYFQHVNGGK